MEKMATEGAVWAACEALVAEGRKVTGRAVLQEVGGSLSTVLRYIESWKKRDQIAYVHTEVPPDLLVALRIALSAAASEAKSDAEQDAADTKTALEEALEALATSESSIVELLKNIEESSKALSDLRAVQNQEAAVASETIAGLREQVSRQAQEIDHLIKSGEAARIETAKAVMQVERADQAAHKAEERVKELDAKLSEMTRMKVDAERDKAVAESRATDLTNNVVRLERALEKAESRSAVLEQDVKSLSLSLAEAEKGRQKAEGSLEQMEIRVNESNETIKRLRIEVDAAVKQKPS